MKTAHTFKNSEYDKKRIELLNRLPPIFVSDNETKYQIKQ